MTFHDANTERTDEAGYRTHVSSTTANDTNAHRVRFGIAVRSYMSASAAISTIRSSAARRSTELRSR